MQRLPALVFAATLAACGGGGDVELTVDPAPRYAAARVVIASGKSFVPDGSVCPPSSEYVRIGTLGPHALMYSNAATGLSGPVFDQLWVCNAEGGRTMAWTSNPIDLAPGDNAITFTMTAGSRRSSGTVVWRPLAP